MVTIGGQQVPLENEPSAAFAYALSNPAIWETELAGFFQGDLFDTLPTQLAALGPYRPGRIPVVLILLRADMAQLRLGSIYGMTPGSPFSKTVSSIPVAPTVTAHSIIAVDGDGPVETGDDGVVEYSSAHIDEAASELVIRSGHSVQSNPKAVAEVRRILLLQWQSACPRGVVRPTPQRR
jgi:hypothetical protein